MATGGSPALRNIQDDSPVLRHIQEITNNRPDLWNCEKRSIQPHLPSRNEGCIDVIVNMYDSQRSSSPEPGPCEDYMFTDGITYGSLKDLYLKVRGIYYQPGKLEDIAHLMEKMMNIRVSQNDLVKRLQEDKFVDFNRVVYWGKNTSRELTDLFNQVKPENYSTDIAKANFLKHVRGEGKPNFNKVACQACRIRKFKGNAMQKFIEHLNREEDEITYMCRTCGYIKFTNFCSFAYHIFSDECYSPKREYCVICKLFYHSITRHLTGPATSLNSWKAKCIHCSFVAYTKCSYELHMAYHINELPYICPECGEFFLYKAKLRHHIRDVCYFEYKLRFYLCISCSMVLSDKELYRNHIQREHYQKLVKCSACLLVLPTERDFHAHHSEFHPHLESGYNINQYCELCPTSSTIRGETATRHLSAHAEDIMSYIILYKCECEFYTRHKQTFTEHKANKKCGPKRYVRPQVMKICGKCDDVKSYNYLRPTFYCEECQQTLIPVFSLMNYYCEICELVIEYSWDSVLDHFDQYHKNIHLLCIAKCVMMLIAAIKILPGHVSKTSIKVTDIKIFESFISSLSSKKRTTIGKDKHEIFGIKAREMGLFVPLPSFSTTRAQIKIRSPESSR